jgi:hypothetical protein
MARLSLSTGTIPFPVVIVMAVAAPFAAGGISRIRGHKKMPHASRTDPTRRRIVAARADSQTAVRA